MLWESWGDGVHSKQCMDSSCDSACNNGLVGTSPAKNLHDTNVSSDEYYASYVFSDERTHKKQSLIAIYTKKALPFLALSIETKMPLQKAIPEEFVKTLYYDKEQEPFFQNLNTIKDLDCAKSYILPKPKV